jgi:hypothetical protein
MTIQNRMPINNEQFVSQQFRYWAITIFPKCQWCNLKLTRRTSTTDHIKPKWAGGTDDLDNLCLSCRDCNERKGSKENLTPRYGPKNWANIKKEFGYSLDKPQDKENYSLAGTFAVWANNKKIFVGSYVDCYWNMEELKEIWEDVEIKFINPTYPQQRRKL